MRLSRGTPPGDLTVDGLGRTKPGKGLVISFVMFLIASLAPAIAGLPSLMPAANAATVTGTSCVNQADSITGSTWIQAGGLPGVLLPGTDNTPGSTKQGNATFSFRYTMGTTNAAAAAGPWSEWIPVTSGAGGDYCVSGLTDFKPTLGGTMGSYIQFSSTTQSFGGVAYVPASMPGQGNAVQANLDPNNLMHVNSAVNITNDSVSSLHV